MPHPSAGGQAIASNTGGALPQTQARFRIDGNRAVPVDIWKNSHRGGMDKPAPPERASEPASRRGSAPESLAIRRADIAL